MDTPLTEKMLSRKEGKVGILTFNNPEKHNAVSFEMWAAAERILQDFLADKEVRVVILTGAGGKAFVSGADISKFADERQSEEAVQRYNALVERLYSHIYEFPKPTIAMIRGHCIGGGLNLAICCDIRIATEGSRFSLPAAKLGLGYGYPGLRRYAETIGTPATKEIFFTARQYNAAEALSRGMVHQVVADADLEPTVMDMANTIAGNAPLTVATIKQSLIEVHHDADKRDLDRCAAMVKACFASNDYIEGRKAFLEKRKPAFTGS
ncbi:MAG: enoyl-CoA hydratase [Alphaproteobacteria bacterium]|nr:enoyl-CoA hydratase [Alphaproteobacteria bacterium]